MRFPLAIFSILLAAVFAWAQPMMNAPNPGNVPQKVDVITNLQLVRPDITEHMLLVTLGSNTLWDGGGSWYRASITNTEAHDGFNVITSTVTPTGRWVRVGPLARLTVTNSVTNLVTVTNTVTNSTGVVDVPEYYQMLTSYDEFKDYPVGAWAETNGGYGWSSSWEVTSGDAEVVTVTTTNDIKFQSELRVDRRLSLNAANSEIVRPLTLSSNWRQLLVGVRFYLPTDNTNLDLVAASGRTPKMAFGLVNQTNGYTSSNHFLGLHSVMTNMICRYPPNPSSTFHEAYPRWNQNGTNQSLYFRDALIESGVLSWESLPFDSGSGTRNYGVGAYSPSDEIAQWVLIRITRQPEDIWAISSVLKDNDYADMMSISLEEGDGIYNSLATTYGYGAGGTTGELLDFFGMRDILDTLMGERNISTDSSYYSRLLRFSNPHYGFMYAGAGNLPDENTYGSLDSMCIFWSHGDIVPMHVAEVYVRDLNDVTEQIIDYSPEETVTAYRGSSTAIGMDWPIISGMPASNRVHKGFYAFLAKNGGQYALTNIEGYFAGSSYTWNWFSSGSNYLAATGLAPGSWDVMGRYYNSGGFGPAGYLGNIQLAAQPAAPLITSTEVGIDPTTAVLTWTDNATNEVGYIVLKCDDLAARFFWDPFTQITTPDTPCVQYYSWDTNIWQEVGRFSTNDVPGLTWTNTGLLSGNYSYMIAATNAAGDVSGYLRPYYGTNDVTIP